MTINKIIASAKNKKYLEINETDLNELLTNSELIVEENTYISDKIRLLKFKDELILQEKTAKNELLIRIMNSEIEARELIYQRLEIYEKMWDGCGCKVNYYE